jgi:hypothetical protein
MIDLTRDPSQEVRNPDVVAFLRHGMTKDEQLWTRFAPRLRPVSEVPVGQLRTHPDLIDRLQRLAGPVARDELQMLMGAPVLVAASGTIYALAFSQDFLALRLSVQGGANVRAHDPEHTRQPLARIALLGVDWVICDVWHNDLQAALEQAVADARALAAARRAP